MLLVPFFRAAIGSWRTAMFTGTSALVWLLSPSLSGDSSRVLAQPLIQLEDTSWVDEVAWRERTDGTRSLVVERVRPGSLLAKADLRRGDRVVGFAGVFPETPEELHELASQMSGADASLTVLRGDRIVVLPLRPVDGQNPIGSVGGAEEIGPGRPGRATPATSRGTEELILSGDRVINGRPLTTEENPAILGSLEGVTSSSSAAQAFGFAIADFRADRYPGYETPVATGVMVEQVVTDSLAFQSGLSAGMIIVAVDGRRVDRAEEVERWLIERANRNEISILAYEGRTLRRVRIPLDRPVSNEQQVEEVVPAAEPRPSMLENLGGLLPLVGPSGNQELIEIEDPNALEALPIPEPSSTEPSLPTPERDAPTRTDGSVQVEPVEPQEAPSESNSSRRGILGGLMRRDSGEGASERNRPIEQRARDAAIENLKRRIERQQRLLEQQMNELKALQEELARLEEND